mgnify:CR=1 FL=1
MIQNFNENYKTILKNSLAQTFSTTPNQVTILDSDLMNDYTCLLTDTNTTLNGNPTLIDSRTIYVGRSILRNNSSVDQKLKTDGFEHLESFSTTSKIVNGFNIGINTTSTFSFNILLSEVKTSVSVDLKYNFSQENSSTSTVTKKITIPSQEILVPANSAIEVVAYFTKGTAKGTVTMDAVFRGYDYLKYSFYRGTTGPIDGHLLTNIGFAAKDTPTDELTKLGFAVEQNEGDKSPSLIARATGEYTCDVANEYIVSITPITNTNSRDTSKTQVKKGSATVTSV